ncbi:uncharacterized protein Nmlp_2189 [Natronomonas moolapensis 8.8.11]|uniref:Uncharacterized protein n=1 Tax=Natronomonas moolapensis (strain DSM 18674 / CECT 7526 / JCM 14361 / 8.8.11) TaxID=268739 RepID=M1XQG1_NATM8|nr:hypothetical protein [Natronomonas moolapensis]CCQ36365.1 uncharacterized protein Nmlp_2189 [Natronomonas moolapensis 8.8.11]
MEDNKIEAIGGALRSDDHRLKAISIISKIDPLPRHLVESWIDDIVFAVEEDNNRYNQYQIYKELKRMTEAYPELATTAVPVVTQELNEELHNLNGKEPSHGKIVNWCTSILQTVIQNTGPDDDFPNFSHSDLDQLLEHGDAAQRSLGYRLLGRIATPQAIRKLVEEPSYEVDSVLNSREVALEEAGRIVASSLCSNGHMRTSDEIVSFSELYATGIISESEGIKHIQNLSLDSLQLDEKDVKEVRTATNRIAAKSKEVAKPIIKKSLALLEQDPEAHRSAWEFLKGVAEGDPNVVSDNSERLSRLLNDADPSSLLNALDVLSFVPRDEPIPVYRTTADQALTDLEQEAKEEDVSWRILSRVAEGAPEVISDNSERISSLIDSAEPNTLSEALDVVSFTSRSGTIRVYHTITERAFSLLEEDLEDRDVVWRFLSRVSKRAPEAILQRSERLIKLIDRREHTDAIEGLGVISTIGRQKSTLPANLGKVALRALESDDQSIVIAAIESVSAAGFYPPPPRLKQLAEGDTKVADKASGVLKELSQRNDESSSSLNQTLRMDKPEIGLFDRTEGDLNLKKRTKEGLWKDVGFGGVRRETVDKVVRHVNRGENAPVVLPYYEPRDVVLIAIAIVLTDPEEERQVGLFSPGSRTHWGMKGEIRKELQRFALSDVAGEVVSAKPIPELVPHAYVWDGEVKNASDGHGPGRFILCKKLRDLKHVSNVDVVLSNLTSRTREDTNERFEDVEDVHPDATFVNTYSYFVKNERDGRPRYGPPLGLDSASTVPGLETIDSAIRGASFDRDSRLNSSLSGSSNPPENSTKDDTEQAIWSIGDDDVRALATSASIKIDHVEAEDISSLLDQVFEKSATLRGVDDGGAGGMIFSRQLFFERLPVPSEDFNEWIRERYYEGERFVPPMIQERIEDVEQRADSVDNLQAVRPLNKSANIFEQIAQILEEQNPMFEALREYIKSGREDGRRVAIFSESPKHAEILRYSLLKREVVTQDELDSATISVVSPDEARWIDPKDVLVVCGVLHKENAGFYLHPRVAQTVVLTYDRTWATMVERHAREFVDTLNGVVAGSDYSPYAYPELSGDSEPEPVNEREVPPDGTSETSSQGSDAQSSASRSATGSQPKSKADILADTIQSVSAREYREESGRYDREVQHYVVETTSGEEVELTNHDRTLRERANLDDVEYHWVSPEALTDGDVFVTIPDELETELWQEQLRNLYEEEISPDHAINHLNDWYNAIEDIRQRVADKLSPDEMDTNSKIHDTIYDRVKGSNDDFDRTKATVRTWFKSVLEADGPIDLVEDPSLTIGPRSYLDIEAIGRAFEYQKLVADPKGIEAAMEGLRTINRQQGHELHDTIKEQMNADKPTRVSEAGTHHTVEEIEEVSEDGDVE